MHRFRRPSAALVLAFAAVVLAVTSSAGANPIAYAAKVINGKTIKKHSIPVSALSASAVKSLRGKTGKTGPRGLQGATGAAGATKVTVVHQACGPAPCTSATVNCPAGARATGGGGIVINSNQLLFDSNPVPVTGTPTGWHVEDGAATPPATGFIIGYAVCASP